MQRMAMTRVLTEMVFRKHLQRGIELYLEKDVTPGFPTIDIELPEASAKRRSNQWRAHHVVVHTF